MYLRKYFKKGANRSRIFMNVVENITNFAGSEKIKPRSNFKIKFFSEMFLSKQISNIEMFEKEQASNSFWSASTFACVFSFAI